MTSPSSFSAPASIPSPRTQSPSGLSAGTTNVTTSNAQVDIDERLLAALVAFIAPIARACAAPASASDYVGQIFADPAVSQRLLDSLKEFIAASAYPHALQSQPKQDSHESNTTLNIPELFSSSKSENEESEEIESEGSQSEQTDADPLTSILQSKISTNLRAYVSSTMPIRLLSFDASGSSIQLLERREVVSLLQPKLFQAACAPTFQALWKEAYVNPMARGFTSPEQVQSVQAAGDSAVNTLIVTHAQYAILSHTWLQEAPGDVIFQDWRTRADNPRGNGKIVHFCRVSAQAHGLGLGWMDTVCINKESSTELDESIRSMYKWYRSATVCIAYLSGTSDLPSVQADSWFTRGWTLQELLAPRDVQFYNAAWENMHSAPQSAPHLDADSDSADIESSIRDATTLTVEEISLFRRGETEAVPISRRLQLAAGRQVTRAEDSAYSLMGLLGVDISVAYGEGPERAFSRLIRELLNTKKEVLDVFNHSYTGAYTSVIPLSPKQYSQRSTAFDVQRGAGHGLVSLLDKWRLTPPLLLTHVGLRMHLLLVPGLLFDSSVDPVSFVSIDTFHRYSYASNIAKGSFYGHYQLYDLLHRDLYLDTPPDRSLSSMEGLPPVLIFGVLNFGMEDKLVLLPDTCLAVPLDCGNCKPGHIRESDYMKVYLPPAFASEPVPFFQLKSVNKGETSIMGSPNLLRNGLQLMTVYL